MLREKEKRMPFRLDGYETRGQRIKNMYKPDTIYACNILNYFFIVFFVIVDWYCLKAVWNLVQTEDAVYVWIIASACAVALDVPLAIAAFVWKKYRQGLCNKTERNIFLITAVIIFSIAFIFSFVFRLSTKDLSFDTGTASTLTNTLATSQSAAENDKPEIMIAAAFNGIIPLLTSGASFALSFISSNPLITRLSKCKRERVRLQSNILDAEKALAETDTAENYCKSLLARENDLYHEFIEELDTDALKLKEYTRLLIMERMATPDSTTILSNSSERIYNKLKVDDVPKHEYANLIKNRVEKNSNSIIEANIA